MYSDPFQMQMVDWRRRQFRLRKTGLGKHTITDGGHVTSTVSHARLLSFRDETPLSPEARFPLVRNGQ